LGEEGGRQGGVSEKGGGGLLGSYLSADRALGRTGIKIGGGWKGRLCLKRGGCSWNTCGRNMRSLIKKRTRWEEKKGVFVSVEGEGKKGFFPLGKSVPR